MLYKCSNDRSLLITKKEEIEHDLGNHLIPCVVLLTSWDSDKETTENRDSLIIFLLDKGTRYFICIGEFSECLHDRIDELAYEYDDQLGAEAGINIITTYHSEESIEEVVEFFLFGSDIWDKKNGCMLAILNHDLTKDCEIRTILESICACGDS